MRGAGVQSTQRVGRSSTPRGAQVWCVAALPNGRVVSGSRDFTLKVWNALTGACIQTLTGHTRPARRRRPVEPCVNCSSTPRGAQVSCVAALSNGHVVSGSWDNTLKVWVSSSAQCLRTMSGHTYHALRRRPVDATRRSLVDAARGAGIVRRRPVERPRRVRVVGQHAQGVGTVERSVPPDAARAHERCAAPASSRTARQSLVDAARGRRSCASSRCRTAASCLGRATARSRSGTCRAAPASGRCAGTRDGRAAASRRTTRRSLVDAATGTGPMRRRHPVERHRRVRVGRPHAQGVGRCRGEDGASGCPVRFT